MRSSIDMTGSASGSGGSRAVKSTSSSSTSTACAACKYQRRKCTPDCPLSPYFPPDQPKRFQNVHKLFGVSNILRILKHVDPSKREDTVKSIAYEADTREKDPVHGCLGVITILQNQVSKLKDELAVARDQLYLLQQQQQNFNQQAQMQQQIMGSSLGGSTSIVNVSSTQETNFLMQNFQSYNDMSNLGSSDFAKSNPLAISSFEPDQYLRTDGFDQIKPGGAASTSRFDVGRYIRGESPAQRPVKEAPHHRGPATTSSMHYNTTFLESSSAGNDNNLFLLHDVEQEFEDTTRSYNNPFARAICRRGESGFVNLTVAEHHELRSVGVYLTLTNFDHSHPR